MHFACNKDKLKYLFYKLFIDTRIGADFLDNAFTTGCP